MLLVWAAIYLPALGSLEIKGEEGRRILPAVAMRESGDWIVPHVGGEPYLSKPPLINWLVALAFQVSGGESEWAARAPTVLAVLALGLGLAWRGGAWLGPGGGLLAALFTLTNVGFMEKGRLAELEGLYAACFGLALVDWLAAWRLGESAWRRWLPPAVFLGLGLLTKGPLHVLFFYAIAGAVLWRAGRLRAGAAAPGASARRGADGGDVSRVGGAVLAGAGARARRAGVERAVHRADAAGPRVPFQELDSERAAGFV